VLSLQSLSIVTYSVIHSWFYFLGYPKYRYIIYSFVRVYILDWLVSLGWQYVVNTCSLTRTTKWCHSLRRICTSQSSWSTSSTKKGRSSLLYFLYSSKWSRSNEWKTEWINEWFVVLIDQMNGWMNEQMIYNIYRNSHDRMNEWFVVWNGFYFIIIIRIIVFAIYKALTG